jgi:hypothetical protein
MILYRGNLLIALILKKPFFLSIIDESGPNDEKIDDVMQIQILNLLF